MDESMQQTIQEAVKESVEASRRTLLGEIGTLFEKISEQNNSSQLSRISCLVAAEQPVFKRKSNEEQYKINSKVLLKLNEGNGNLDQQKFLEAKANFTEAIDMLSHRQKLIQLADSSELGWRVVQEYETNPLAEDSEDEKRMYKAEARATRKLKAERAKKAKSNRNWPYKRGNGSQGQSAAGVQTSTASVQKPGLCFQCGKPGHWRQECPGNASNNKISIGNNVILRGILNGSDPNSKDVQSYCQAKIVDNGRYNNSEERSKSISNVISPVGRLKSHIDKWRSVEGSAYIKDVVENGYKLPFKEFPAAVSLKNNKSARDNPSFVTTEIGNLLEKGVISMVKEKPLVVNPLTVAYNKKGKPRLVLDCRHVNQHIHLFKIKFEDTRVAISLFGKGIYAFTYDLKSAYHHIDIYESHKTYLGFSWNYFGEKTYFIFNSLPFGLSSAGHIFSKTVRVIVKYLRALGHNVVMFLDDGIGGHNDYDKALSSSKIVKKTFCEFGFLIAEEKCLWIPSKVVSWLGCVFDYERNRLYVSEERIDMIEKSISSIMFQLEQSTYSILNVRVLASLVGRIISLQLVFGNITRLRTREMYNCIITRTSWNAPILVSKEAVNEITFWKDNVRYLNCLGRALDMVSTCDVNVFCDASATGYGGYIELLDDTSMFENIGESFLSLSPEVDRGPGRGYVFSMSPEVDYIPPEEGKMSVVKRVVCSLPAEEGTNLARPIVGPEISQSAMGCMPGRAKCERMKPMHSVKNAFNSSSVVGSWLDEEKKKSSTWREAEAINRVLKSHVGRLRNKAVRVFSDNKNICSILSNGSRKTELQNVSLHVKQFCDENGISLNTEWIPRDQNQTSDYLSRCQDSDDWSIAKSWFNYFDSIWGKYTVDRFSTHYNNQCKRFNSRWWVPGSEAVDAFTQAWKNENNWLVPPPRLILDCINKIEEDQAECTLIIPKWKSSAFWSRLVDNEHNFNHYVKAVKVLPTEGLICIGKGNNGVFARTPLPFQILALKMVF